MRCLAAALWLVAAVALREVLEQRMVSHALGQLPALALAGALLSVGLDRPGRRPSGDWLAPPALLLAVFSGAIWMLPRMLDASLATPAVEVAKLVTVPLLVGYPLAWSWPRLGSVTRAFVWSNLISMLVALGWLYLAAPVRVCSYYLLSEQQELGKAYLALSVAIVCGWLVRLFVAPADGQHRPPAALLEG